MGLRKVRGFILTLIGSAGMSACSSYSLEKPKDGDIVRLPAKTAIAIKASPSLSQVVIKLDGSDVSNQVTWSTTPGEGDLNVAAGKHTLVADADVPCWYCSGKKYRHSAQATFCTAGPWPAGTPTSTAFRRVSNAGWDKTSDATISVAPDAGAARTRWNLVRVSGITQSIGIIQSTENTCLCMVSTADQSETPIGLAICDASNPTHLWEAFPKPGTGHFRFQNRGRSTSGACLTEGASKVLVQRGCLDTDEQLWRIRDDATGNFVGPF